MAGYIKYDGHQRQIQYAYGFMYQPGIYDPVKDSEGLESEFRPTRLVRVEDMEIISGSDVNEPYWALSYSWNQSGKIIPGDDEDERIDEGQHEITAYETHTYNNWRGKFKAVDAGTIKKRFVTFECLIQQICLDFDIKYIWYDQMCIDQKNHDMKAHEIHQMHLIYQNARCTLALVPELEADNTYNIANIDILPDCQWSKRIWTLEEAYMSKHTLFVGRNVHLWSNEIDMMDSEGKTVNFLSNIRDNKVKWKACTVLWYARTRTSSKVHDRIFALVNIFPELKDRITFSYEQPLVELMIQFYSLLAQSDPSILCFGAPLDPDTDEKIEQDRRNEAASLPSWSGATGIHITQDHIKPDSIYIPIDYNVTGKKMFMTSTVIQIYMSAPEVYEKSDSFDALFPSKDSRRGSAPEPSTEQTRICRSGTGFPFLNFVPATEKQWGYYYHGKECRASDRDIRVTVGSSETDGYPKTNRRLVVHFLLSKYISKMDMMCTEPPTLAK
ncbi:hypothetical protein BJV82DRAFT_657230 [Fennellomyces sp. T-0311]|nr:hypothetical protein BJV82DRAFT_657230 [Fennellomyces sp. T-0311]